MVSIIVAKSKNNVIGNNNKLPWNISEDMKRFKELTTGNVVIMGRKTYESLPEQFRPLPNRLNIVITRNPDYKPNGVMVYDDLQKAILKAGTNKEIFIIGGGEIYKEGLKFADRLYITEVDGEFEGDTYFPEISSNWIEMNVVVGDGYRFIDMTYSPCLVN